MHKAFELFTEETRRKVADLFVNHEPASEDTRCRPVPVKAGEHSDVLDCCPLGACMLLDQIIFATKPVFIGGEAQIKVLDANGHPTQTKTPSAYRIVMALFAKGLPVTSGHAKEFSSFYVPWDTHEITADQLPELMGVDL